jgi:DNA-binding response OmpR family regulator
LQILSDHRILVVEDEALIAFELEDAIREAGGLVAGPVATAAEALLLIDQENPTAAVLDLQLNPDTSLPVARRLAEKGIPFLFYTAYAKDIEQWVAVPILKKPVTSAAVVNTLATLVGRLPEQGG